MALSSPKPAFNVASVASVAGAFCFGLATNKPKPGAPILPLGDRIAAAAADHNSCYVTNSVVYQLPGSIEHYEKR
jgi:hypothetical protein